MRKITVFIDMNSSQNFERKISKFFPSAKYVSLDGLRLHTFAGYGQYKNYLSLTVDGVALLLSLYHTNSIAKDYFCSEAFDNLSERTQDNYIKGCVLDILEANATYLK